MVDDHAVLREGLKRILSDEPDLTVAGEASTGEDGVRLLRKSNFDIVLLDLSMPGRGGVDALKAMRRIRPATPVLVLSMHAEEQYAQRCFRAGASGYVMKERPPEELLEAIRTVASGGHYVPPQLQDRLEVNPDDDPSLRPHHKLSDREDHVFRELARGRPLRDIASEMRLSVKTVSTFKRRIFEKLEITNSAGLVRYAIDNSIH